MLQAIKRSLVLVCKAWNILAAQYLYEYLVFDDEKLVRILAKTLCNRTSGAGRSWGWWTKRIDISISLTSLESALRHFPNLVVVKFTHSQLHENAISSNVMRTIAQTCGPSLRVIYWANTHMPPHFHDLMNLLKSTPNLHMLCCPRIAALDSKQLDAQPILPALKILVLMTDHCREYYHDTNVMSFPSLRALIYNAGSPRFPHPLQPLLQVHGHLLITIAIHLTISSELWKDLELISRYCINLKRLDLRLLRWNDLQPTLILPSTVTQFGIRSLVCGTATDYLKLFHYLCRINAPSMKVVQIVDSRIVADLCHDRNSQILLMGLAALKSKGITLIDHQSRVIECSLILGEGEETNIRHYMALLNSAS